MTLQQLFLLWIEHNTTQPIILPIISIRKTKLYGIIVSNDEVMTTASDSVHIQAKNSSSGIVRRHGAGEETEGAPTGGKKVWCARAGWWSRWPMLHYSVFRALVRNMENNMYVRPLTGG